MKNNHHGNHELCFYDVMLSFLLKAPDQKKAIAALEILFGPVLVSWLITYKKQFKSYQDWRVHLIASLDNAQEKVDAESRKEARR